MQLGSTRTVRENGRIDDGDSRRQVSAVFNRVSRPTDEFSADYNRSLEYATTTTLDAGTTDVRR